VANDERDRHLHEWDPGLLGELGELPASTAAWMIRIDSLWSGSPQAPNIIAPRHSFETATPVRPSIRCSMGTP
jgi:hypothetical protein